MNPSTIQVIGFIFTFAGSLLVWYGGDKASREQSNIVSDTNQNTKALLQSKEKPNASAKRLIEIIDNEYKIAEKKLQSESKKESIAQMIQKVKDVTKISSIKQNVQAETMMKERKEKASNFSIFAKPLVKLVNREIGNLLKQLIKEGYILNVTTVDGIFVDFDSLFEFSNITVEQKHTKQTILAYTKKNEEIMIAYIDISEQEISIVFSPNINRLKIEIRENNIKIGWIVGTEQRLTGTGGGVYKYTELKKDAKKEELIKKLREGLQWSLSGLIEEP